MSRPCPLCLGTAGGESFPYQTVWGGTRFGYLHCRDCGAVFVDPVPSADQLVAIYDWSSYHEHEYREADDGRYAAAANRLARLRTPAMTSLVDFGCGAGYFLVAAARQGFDVHGVEVTTAVADEARRATGFPVTTLESVESVGTTFDVVVLRDVLPHLPEPAEMLRRLERRLRPGGTFFFDSPLEEGPSVVRSVAGAVKAARRAVGRDVASTFAPTMLLRVDARTQRRFLVERMGYREELFERYETGWPYHVPGRRPKSLGVALKEGVAVIARLAAKVAPLGNRFYGMYRPNE